MKSFSVTYCFPHLKDVSSQERPPSEGLFHGTIINTGSATSAAPYSIKNPAVENSSSPHSSAHPPLSLQLDIVKGCTQPAELVEGWIRAGYE